MANSIKIANAGGYWGDDLRQFKRQIELGPVDFVTLDFLAEITMSIMQKQRARDPRAGYARDFVRMVEDALPAMVQNGTRAISNAGGVNPLACRAALIEMAQQHGQDIEVAAITGDDLMGRLGELNASGVSLDNMDDGARFAPIRDHVSSANAYYGAWPVVEALDAGARIVVTGRCTDTGITLAPMIHAFGWAPDDWDRLAAGIVAGHIVECGAQSTGGNFTDWRTVPRFHEIGYPLIEVFEDGSFIVTKHRGTGGRVTFAHGERAAGLRDGRSARLHHARRRSPTSPARGSNRWARSGARVGREGAPRARCRSRCRASYFEGWKAAGTLIISAPEAVDKANAFAQLFWKRLGLEFTETRTELIGHSACWGPLAPPSDPPEILLRLAVRDPDKGKIEEFGKMLPAVILSGPPGVAVTGGRPPAQEVVAYWPALVPPRSREAHAGHARRRARARVAHADSLRPAARCPSARALARGRRAEAHGHRPPVEARARAQRRQGRHVQHRRHRARARSLPVDEEAAHGGAREAPLQGHLQGRRRTPRGPEPGRPELPAARMPGRRRHRIVAHRRAGEDAFARAAGDDGDGAAGAAECGRARRCGRWHGARARCRVGGGAREADAEHLNSERQGRPRFDFAGAARASGRQDGKAPVAAVIGDAGRTALGLTAPAR